MGVSHKPTERAGDTPGVNSGTDPEEGLGTAGRRRPQSSAARCPEDPKAEGAARACLQPSPPTLQVGSGASAGQRTLQGRGAGSPHRCTFALPHFPTHPACTLTPSLGPHADGGDRHSGLGPGRKYPINVYPVTHGLSQEPGVGQEPGLQTAGGPGTGGLVTPCRELSWLCPRRGPLGRCPVLLDSVSLPPCGHHTAAGSP